jgi:hypothetical protein
MSGRAIAMPMPRHLYGTAALATAAVVVAHTIISATDVVCYFVPKPFSFHAPMSGFSAIMYVAQPVLIASDLTSSVRFS